MEAPSEGQPKRVDYAGSDREMKPEEDAKDPDLRMFPTMAG